VFLPKYFAQAEVAHSYEFTKTVLVMAAWAITGAVLCSRSFRWIDKD
jgi:hypothetical protein